MSLDLEALLKWISDFFKLLVSLFKKYSEQFSDIVMSLMTATSA